MTTTTATAIADPPRKLAPRPSQFSINDQYKYAFWNLLHTPQEQLIDKFGGEDAFPAGYVSELRTIAKALSGWDGTAVSMTPHGMPVSPPHGMPISPPKISKAVAVVTQKPVVLADKVKTQCEALNKGSTTRCSRTTSDKSTTKRYCSAHCTEWDHQKAPIPVAATATAITCSATNKDGTPCSKHASAKSSTRLYCTTHAVVWDLQYTTQQTNAALRAQQKQQQSVADDEKEVESESDDS